MNIYIKTFNRPFYLERCIKSVLFNVSNYDEIIILDDGTQKEYKEKIIQLFPQIKWVTNADGGKYELVRSGNTQKARELYGDPASFWLREVMNDPHDYFLLIEDDTWFVNMLDLNHFEEVLNRENSVICKLFWGDYNAELEDASISQKYKLWNDLSIHVINPSIQSVEDVYKIYIVAMAIFRKDYYENAIRKVNHFADETTQITESLAFFQNMSEVSYCKTNERFIYQGWATSVRHDDAITVDVGINSFDFVDILNEAWFNNRLDVLANYPLDFDMDYLVKLFRIAELPEEKVKVYMDWRTKPQLNPTKLYYN
jgi:glycosyltransferase involved in cell wall biosynthesis